jgi:hypothetical protein
MRSIIEEIAAAEQQAEDVLKDSASKSREFLVQARDQAERALAIAEEDERIKTEQALLEANARGDVAEKKTLADMAKEADEICSKAKMNVDSAVSYLIDKVQRKA